MLIIIRVDDFSERNVFKKKDFITFEKNLNP